MTDAMDAAAYHRHLEANWEQTQRLLKKQIHLED